MGSSKKGMGPTKKQLKNRAKAQKRMTPKAKKKVQKARQIEKSNKVRASKRKAAEAVQAKTKPVVSGDMNSEISAVDKLFASIGEGEEEEDNEPLDDGSDDSSAGAFHEVGTGDQDLVEDEEPLGPGDMKALEDSGDEGDAGARHEEELKAIKEKDPEFYKFLVESDKSLLDFRAPAPAEMDLGEEDAGDEEGEEEAAEEKAAKGKASAEAVQAARKVLTPERLHRIQDTVMDSFTSCKAALNIYHTAVRTIEGRQTETSDASWKQAEEERLAKEAAMAAKKGEKKPKAKPKKKNKARPGLMEIEDEAIFSEVIEWSLANLLGAFRHHAGKLRKGPAPGGKKKKGKKNAKQEEEFAEEPEAGTAVDVRRYARWLRVQILVKIFWDETFFLLNHMVGQQMIEYLLRHISGPQAISWLWPFRKVRSLLIKKCILVWSQASAQPVRLLAFLFLRNVGAMALQERESTVKKTPLLDDMIRTMVKGFAQAAAAGFSWRSCNSFRVMENCFVEMLRLDDTTAYRLGYVCIRQLATILRNASIAVNHHDHSKSKGQATSMARGKNKKVVSEKQRKKRAHYMQAAQSLVAWPFVRGIYLWTKAVGSLPSLRELAYPLSMVIMGAVKSQIGKVQMFPFIYHCLLCQNRLGASLGVYVPISSHLMKCLEVMNVAVDKAWQKRRSAAASGKDNSSAGLGGAKAPEVEVLTHFGEGQRYDSLTLEAVGGNLCFLLVDHMGLLSQSPAFPELVSIVLIHIRKHRKHCGSEAMRRQLTTFIQAAEETAEQVRLKREALTEAPSFKKFLLFDADTSMAKLRVTMTKRKADEEKQRIEAETRDDEKPEGAGDNGDAKKKKRKGRRQREVEEAAAEAAEAAAAEAAKPAKKRRRKAEKDGASVDQKTDKVEEMGFSSEED